MTAREILHQLEGQRVLIVGDVMLDRYLEGAVSRISPEAPVPVVLFQGTYDRLGGAANVALNVHALGSEPILCSVVGDDDDGRVLSRILPEAGLRNDGLVFSPRRKTTVKTRVLGNHQQMLRIDREDTHDLFEDEEKALIRKVLEIVAAQPIQALIFQDYNKGVLTPKVIAELIRLAREHDILTAVDPKKTNFFAFRQVDFFKPNLKEVRDSVPFPVAPEPESLKKAVGFLQKQLGNRITMITLSEKGLFLDDGNHSQLYPTIPRNISDVSGAGDTVISVASLGLATRLPGHVVAALSNLAGGQVCEHTGVVPVDRSVLERELEHWLNHNTQP